MRASHALLGSSGDFRDANGILISKVIDYRRIEAKIGRNYDGNLDTEGRYRDGSVQFCEWSVESTPEALAATSEPLDLPLDPDHRLI